MSSRYFHSNGEGGRQEPGRRVSPKTVMTKAYFSSSMSSRPGNRGMELATGLAHVDGYTIVNALVNEKELTKKVEELSKTNPEKSERLKLADRVDRIANPLLLIPIAVAGSVLAMSSPLIPLVAVGAALVLMTGASIWVLRVRKKERPDETGLEIAKAQLAAAADAKAELCAKTGLSERFVEMLQALPLDGSQKHTVLKQAIFHEGLEEYVQRVAGILEGISARGEDLKEFAGKRLEYLSRDISRAKDLAEAGESKASSGDNAQASALFVDAAKALEGVLDYAGAAEMYKKASDASLTDKRRAAELSGKAGDCYLKAGDKSAARERYEWAAMIAGNDEPGLSSEFQGKAVVLI